MSVHDLFGNHDPPGPEEVLRVYRFSAEEPEILHDLLEQLQLFASAILATTVFESATLLVVKIHSFRKKPDTFDDLILAELKIFEGVTCIYIGEEPPCQEQS